MLHSIKRKSIQNEMTKTYIGKRWFLGRLTRNLNLRARRYSLKKKLGCQPEKNKFYHSFFRNFCEGNTTRLFVFCFVFFLFRFFFCIRPLLNWEINEKNISFRLNSTFAAGSDKTGIWPTNNFSKDLFEKICSGNSMIFSGTPTLLYII